jgi:hypothetical protein
MRFGHLPCDVPVQIAGKDSGEVQIKISGGTSG